MYVVIMHSNQTSVELTGVEGKRLEERYGEEVEELLVVRQVFNLS